MDNIDDLNEKIDIIAHRVYVLKKHISNLYEIHNLEEQTIDENSKSIRRLEYVTIILAIAVIIESYLLILK